ncbi:ABC transporter permease [Roseiterribacter gracilis]|uniref:Iron ABC transporter permease n=1 Tax=Roseiterribacter gracilis TaxID=2812848 RepID=A0A8S8XAJ9_9PROT|nr:iron ABC transporter permease [Rhodospirillales bacterium TMPK1]
MSHVATQNPPAARAEGAFRARIGGWGIATILLSLPVLVPLATVAAGLFHPDRAVWEHLVDTVLGVYVINTVLLALCVGAGTLLLGVSSAWLVTMCRFPLSRHLNWVLLLPLAMPTYLSGYAYTDLLQFTGPVQTALRALTGWQHGDYWAPEIRSLGGAAIVMSLVLYPYVYLLARAAFLAQSVCVLEAARTLGRSPWRGFVEVALPLARPAIVGGLALALMETLADFGTVSYFGVDTFTTGIYRTWFAMGEPVAATQLAALLMLCVFTVLVFERASRGPARFDHTTQRWQTLPGYRLRGLAALGAFTACLLPPLLGFAVPAAHLAKLAWEEGDQLRLTAFVDLATNSLTLAALGAVVTTAAAVILAYGLRLAPAKPVRWAARLATLGYAIPGSVIAVGLLVPFAYFDNTIDSWARASFGLSTGLMLTGGMFALLFAYLVRFLAVAANAMESGLGKVSPSLDAAARTLGRGPTRTLFFIHLPIVWGSVLTALLTVFVDVMKELPATLIVRPFNFETLATRVYRLASDERLGEASTASLLIVAVGLVPVILLSRAVAASRPGTEQPPL